MRYLRHLYHWCITLGAHPYALWLLAAISFAEASFFPIPPDVVLIPMVLATPKRAWLIAGVCTLSSVAGGVLGYMIGAWAYEGLGQPMLAWAGKEHYFDVFAQRYNQWGVWVVFSAALTPFPYKVITILSGAAAMPLGTFILTSLLARAMRFFIISALLWKFGPDIHIFIQRRLGMLFTLFMCFILMVILLAWLL